MHHPTAVIEPGAELGENVEVGPFSYIEGGVRIGDGCRLGPRVTILKGSSIGANCTIHAGAVIGDVPQDLAFDGAESSVEVGERCIIREGVTIHRGTKPGTITRVGDECFLMAYCHVAHNCLLGDNVIIANNTVFGGYVEIGARAFISGLVAIHQFVRVGRLAMVAGGSVATKDVPPFCTTRNCAMNTVVGINVVGMRRAGLGGEQRKLVRSAIKALYRSDMNVSQAVEHMRQSFSDEFAMEICDFIDNSDRGICTMAGLSSSRSGGE
ncbi:MAG: acyl-ACP--UDP-N-acetylglucosamine O-acyltransferase [Kiritimatiellia bacterium]|jgi:UDP-N-acetylglucosamine acyltransferase|nr:acyl-ACP--UDP-N-acetylglucosamine O-acyltransferase [Kiritimatiellia bacterium]MDP6848427.1 acyl-ACP--UDP-N-acetylglucosamine O-acyltransferase [Kiritimatiellia bacterium]